MSTDDFRPLLCEIGCEELPPPSQPELALSLCEALQKFFERTDLLGPGEPQVWWTPRRLAVLFPAVRRHSPPYHQRVSGPLLARAYDSTGRPSPALIGFARAQGVEPDRLERDGERIVAVRLVDGTDLAVALESELPVLLSGLACNRRMVWTEDLPPFSRPIRRLTLLHGDEILPVHLGTLRAGGDTAGHRIHHPKPVRIPSALDYPQVLLTASIVPVSLNGRDAAREHLQGILTTAASALAGELPSHPTPWHLESDLELLDENLGLLEHPAAVAGTFDTAYLELPEEVIRVVLRVKQRAFVLRDSRGTLLPAFVAPVNLESRDPRRLRRGFERVVRPRLADALFFFRQDREHPLEDRLRGLSEVTLEHGLGSLADRTQRLVELTGRLAPILGVQRTAALRAAQLSQCDLLTAIVGEYPELEGTAGGFYARLDGEDESVSTALAEHVLPRRPGDPLPQSPTGALLALALRLEILCGSFARGVQPSGQSDPMGLRRAAGGLLQILLTGILEADLLPLFKEGLAVHGVDGPASDELVERLYAFHLERLSSIFATRTDLFQAVAAVRPTSPMDFRDRLLALQSALDRDDAARLVALNKRIQNILRRVEDAQPRSDRPPDGEPPASQALDDLVTALELEIPERLAQRDFATVLERLLDTGHKLERFFTEVLVMDPDTPRRLYRIALLKRLDRIMHAVAALEKIHVPSSTS